MDFSNLSLSDTLVQIYLRRCCETVRLSHSSLDASSEIRLSASREIELLAVVSEGGSLWIGSRAWHIGVEEDYDPTIGPESATVYVSSIRHGDIFTGATSVLFNSTDIRGTTIYAMEGTELQFDDVCWDESTSIVRYSGRTQIPADAGEPNCELPELESLVERALDR